MNATVRLLARIAASLLVVLSVCVLFVRCTPLWLPDSSGFVYLTQQGEVKLVNVKDGETKVIVKLPNATAAIGLSPAGDRVAVAQLSKAEGKSATMQVLLYDLTGKQLHASEIHPLEGFTIETKLDENLLMAEALVSPSGRYVCVCLPAAQTICVYDLNEKTFREHAKVLSVSLLAMLAMQGEKGPMVPASVSPYLPAGDKFLAVRQTAESDEPQFIAIPLAAGEPQVLKVSAEELELMKKQDQADAEKISVRTCPEWKRGRLEMQVDQGTLSIDPAQMQVTFQEDMQADILWQIAQRNEAHLIAVLDDQSTVQAKDKTLQIYTRDGRTKTIMELGEGPYLFPIVSPDKRKLILRSIDKGALHFKVVDHRGETLLEVK